MTIAISSEDPRSIKAISIAARASQWLKVRTVEGELAFGIPSQCAQKPGRYYLVTASQMRLRGLQTQRSHPRPHRRDRAARPV